jgi:hypothetical protein
MYVPKGLWVWDAEDQVMRVPTVKLVPDSSVFQRAFHLTQVFLEKKKLHSIDI